ncbi:MAG: GlsB/YeaQ/YmgE family stress response membrane protein [Deltaproteobacteria bacterium]|nr:GlsB/YeaQ/YmgE family stress response membrane protein [Deltaproteobacteria bacterium]
MGIGHVIWTLIVGLVVGAVARLLMPGQEHLGFFMTSLLGVVGSFVGGFIGSVISRPTEGSVFHPAGFVLSVIGAIVVLVLWHHLM